MFIVFLAIPASVKIAHADVVELPPITVIGTRGSKCRTITSCGLMAGIDRSIPDISSPYEAPTIGIEEENDDSVDAMRCNLLRLQRPQNCGFELGGSILFDMPSVPGYDPSWSGNGCGTGGGVNAVIAFLTPGLYPDFYELNEPYQGVSFLDACNNHDQCFATGGSSFNQCNEDFFVGMTQACNGILRCRDFASLYRSGVASQIGQNAYNNAQTDVTCAEWQDLMEINDCPDDS